MAERIETVIIGAGQAGLATAQQLHERGRECIILDGNQRIGDNWRRHYDSLRLYNPAWACSLPGLEFPGRPDRYPTRDEAADYLERYAAHLDLPVRLSTWVRELRRGPRGYVVTTDRGELHADNVVVATGTFGAAYTPPFASELDPGILQLHSSEYKRPSQLQPGTVLVVGASHSGADVAYELAHHERTVLVGRDTGELPFDSEGRAARRFIWPLMSFVARRVLTIKTPIGRKARSKIRAHGGPLIRYKTRHLLDAGVERIEGRVTGVEDGLPVLDDGRVISASNVIWCTGFKQDFSWIRLPVFGEDGWPHEERGVVADAPGLYFMGLAVQFSFASMLFVGVGQDAAYIADHIATRAEAPAAVGAA
ncbi:MAG: NAD(P)-binding domain-containing protein [Nitriliruptorales bacterium]|nr:NAD(P)-binding domain-containing protein [Nitriliruptorales bacterium]